MKQPKLRSPAFLSALATAVLLGCASSDTTAAQEDQSARAPHGLSSKWGDYLAGHHAESTGNTDRALKFYDSAVGHGLTGQGDLHSRLYILNLTEGHLNQALAALDRAQQLDASAPLSELARTVAAMRDGDYDGVLEHMGGEANAIGRIVAPVLRAWARVGQGDMDGALDELSAMEGGDGGPAPLQTLHQALITEVAGDPAAARPFYEAMIENGGLSLRTAELLGAFYERIGERARAREVYERLGAGAERNILMDAFQARTNTGKKPPLDVQGARDGAAEALYGVASALLSQNAWESAQALAHLALALRSDFPPAQLVVAGALDQNGRHADANAVYATVPAASPFSWMARLRMADNLDRMGDTDRSIATLQAIADERTDQARPLIELGDVLRRHERFSEAAEAYTRALDRLETPEDRHWVLFYSRGIAYEQTDRWAEAEEDFLKALALNPEQPLVLNYLGYSWIDQGLHLERALKMIETAVEKRPRDGYIVDSLGWGHYRVGDYAQAVKHLERAVMLRPGDPIINDHLGDALWRVGRNREARFQWERALSMDPDDDLAAELNAKLERGLGDAQPKN